MTTIISTRAPVDMDGLASAMAAQKCHPGSVIVLSRELNGRVSSYIDLNREKLPLVEPEGDLACTLLVGINVTQKEDLEELGSLVDEGAGFHSYDRIAGKDECPDKAGKVGATTTLLVEEIIEKGYSLSEWESTLMAMGIYEATGNLLFTSTTKRDVAALGFLWEQGVDIEYMRQFLATPPVISRKTILEKLVSQTEFFELNRLRIMFCWAYVEDYPDGFAEIVHRLGLLNEADVLLCLVKIGEKIKLIARAFDDNIDLRELLEFWKVKGHARAVSETFDSSSVYRIRRDLLDILASSSNYPFQARDIATYPVQGIDSGISVSEAIEMLASCEYSGMPVFEGEKAIGMISRKELYRAQRHLLGDAPVKSFLKKEIVCAGPEDSVTSLMQTMAENNVKRVIITDHKADRASGIVTRTDLMRFLGKRSPGVTGKKQPGDVFIKPAGADNLESIEDLTPLINKVLSPRLQRLLLLIGQRADKDGVSVYLVGGVVRDLLMGRGIPEDLDLVVIPDAISFARTLNRNLQGELTEHETFGTASIRAEGFPHVDLVTARREHYAFPAALPQVEASSLKNDLFRRDFTINTLACSLNLHSFGALFDYFGGRKDLNSGMIRILYNLSFVDDPLRILRAVRFASRFGFIIEEETLQSIKKALNNRLLDQVSRERLNKEIRLIFQEKDPPRVMKRMADTGVLSFLFPRLRPTVKTWSVLGRVKETIEWSRRREWIQRPDEDVLYLGAFFLGLKKADVRFWGTRLQLSREKIEKLEFAVEEIPRIMEELAVCQVRPGQVLNILGNLPAETLLLIRALAPNPRVKNFPGYVLDSLRHVRARVDAAELKQMGLEPGPMYGRVLEELKEAILDGRVRTLEEEREFVLSSLESTKGVS